MPASSTPADQRLFYCFLCLLVWAPLPFGSNRPWCEGLLFLLSALLFIAWLYLFMTRQVKVAASAWHNFRWPVLLLAAVQLWVFIQSLRIPRALVEWLSPNAADLQLATGWIPLSLDPQNTRLFLLQGLSCTIGFCLTLLLVNRRERITRFLWAIVISGSFQAVYGALMTLSGLEYGFLVEKYSGVGVATGTFVNRNHLAGYLVMALAAGIGLLISQLGGEAGNSARARLRAWLNLLLSAKFRLRLMLAFMVVGLVLTRSRMGNLSFFVSMSMAGFVVLVSTRRQVTGKVFVLLASLLLVDLLIVGRWFGVDEVAEHLVQTSVNEESRGDVDVFSLGILRDFPLTGSGGGTFYTVFPHYSGTSLGDDYYLHAHNDYLELAGDLGIPAFMLLVLLVGLGLWRAFWLQYRSESGLSRGLGFAVLMLIGWVALHAAVDFNLYIPANSFTFTCLLAIAWLERSKTEKQEEFPRVTARSLL